MSRELQKRRSSDKNPEVDELVEMEGEANEYMREARYNDTVKDSKGFIERSKSKVDKNTKRIEGVVEDVEKVNDSKIKVKISYDGGSFYQRFRITDSNDIDGNKLYRLLDYKNIRDGRFLDLRGKSVPIDIRGHRKRIVVPKRKGKLSDFMFKILQKSRKYKLVRSRLSKNNYQMTFLGYLIFSGILAPFMFTLSDVFSVGTSVMSQAPLISPFATIFTALSVLSSAIGAFSAGVFVILAIGFSLMILLFTITESHRYVKSKIWPF